MTTTPMPAGPPLAEPVSPAKPWYKRTWFIGTACLLTGIGIGSAGNSSAPADSASASAPVQTVVRTVAAEATPEQALAAAHEVPATQAPVSKPQAQASFGEGTYVVGEDIKPGVYKSKGPSDGSYCYWARLKNTDGDFDSIITNGTPKGPTTVTIKKSDGAFETNGCENWVKR